VRSTDDLPSKGKVGLVREFGPHRFGNAEIDDLGNRLVVVHRHDHIGRLDIPVNHPFLMGVLNPLADLVK